MAKTKRNKRTPAEKAVETTPTATAVETKTKATNAEPVLKTKTPAIITPETVNDLGSAIKAKVSDNKNKESAAQKIQYERDLKWLYPEDCTDTGDRKVFRSKSRNKIRRLEAHALKAEGAIKEAKMAEILAARKELLVNPESAV